MQILPASCCIALAWRGVVWCGVVWCGVVWYLMIDSRKPLTSSWMSGTCCSGINAHHWRSSTRSWPVAAHDAANDEQQR
jgi:hypothetical protein